MNPLLMDAVVAAREEELRRAARHPGPGRRGSRIRAWLRHPAGKAAARAACAEDGR